MLDQDIVMELEITRMLGGLDRSYFQQLCVQFFYRPKITIIQLITQICNCEIKLRFQPIAVLLIL